MIVNVPGVGKSTADSKFDRMRCMLCFAEIPQPSGNINQIAIVEVITSAKVGLHLY